MTAALGIASLLLAGGAGLLASLLLAPSRGLLAPPRGLPALVLGSAAVVVVALLLLLDEAGDAPIEVGLLAGWLAG